MAKIARNAQAKHDLVIKLTADANAIDKNIVEEMARLETGFWECEDGHKSEKVAIGPMPDDYKE